VGRAEPNVAGQGVFVSTLSVPVSPYERWFPCPTTQRGRPRLGGVPKHQDEGLATTTGRGRVTVIMTEDFVAEPVILPEQSFANITRRNRGKLGGSSDAGSRRTPLRR
jgi:hypothetical protein